MTFPTVVAISTYTSSVDENVSQITSPSGIQRGDILFLFESVQNDGGGIISVYAGPNGFHMLWNFSQSTIRGRCFYKICDGTESSTAYSWAGPNTSGRANVAVVVRGADPYVGPFCGTGAGGTSVTNPDPPTRTAPWGSADNLWLIYCAGLAATAISGTPQNGSSVNYSGNTLIAAATTNAVAAAFAHSPRAAATEDPTAWTRASSTWRTNTLVVPPVLVEDAMRARVRFSQTLTLDASLNPDDVIVRVEGGSQTRLLCGISAAGLATSDSCTCTLDPAGANIALSLVTDGSTSAEEDGSTTAGTGDGMRWFTTLAASGLTPGNYTLRFTGGYTSTAHIVFWMELENVDTTSVNVTDVTNVRDTTSDDIVEGAIDGTDRGLIVAMVGPFGLWPNTLHTFNGVRPMCYGEADHNLHSSLSRAVFVGRSIAGSNALHFEVGADGTSNAMHFTAISIAAAALDSLSAPLHGAL